MTDRKEERRPIVRIKIVPDDFPNADGEWRDLPAPVLPEKDGWVATEAAVACYAPEGFHVVGVSSR
jgi:hypothetical protein